MELQFIAQNASLAMIVRCVTVNISIRCCGVVGAVVCASDTVVESESV